MPRSPATAGSDLRAFDERVRSVRLTLLEGKVRIEQATVFANWETGRLIDAHVLHHRHRAGHAAQVMSRLARRVGISERVLYHCAQFHRLFPILNTRSILSWSHFRSPCQVGDERSRTALTRAAGKSGWTARELEERVRRGNLSAPAAADPAATARAIVAPQPAATPRGTPGLCPVITRREGFALDLGFKVYRPLTAAAARRLRLAAGDSVQCPEAAGLGRADAATAADLLTCLALATRVVDGDSLAVTLALPPDGEIVKNSAFAASTVPNLPPPRAKRRNASSRPGSRRPRPLSLPRPSPTTTTAIWRTFSSTARTAPRAI